MTEHEPRPEHEDPDHAAVQAARRGDRGAYDGLVRRHERRIYRLACRLLSDPHAALDATQETFVRAWRALDRFEGAARFTTWLTRIAINQCRNELRRRRSAKHARPLSLDEVSAGTQVARIETIASPAPDAYAEARGAEVERALVAALDEVDPQDREVLVLREVEDLSYEGIAQILGVAVGTVRSRLHRARADLRRRMSAVLDR